MNRYLLLAKLTSAASPLTKGTGPFDSPREKTVPETTWPNKTFCRALGSARRPSRAPDGSDANASSVGAKRVNGPAESRVETRFAASAAFTKVPNRWSPANAPTIVRSAFGTRTFLMTWMTPLLAAMVLTTSTPLTVVTCTAKGN